MSKPPAFLPLAAAAAIFSTSAGALAQIVWSDDFTGQADALFPNRDFTGNSVNDYVGTTTPAFFTVSASDGGPAPSLTLPDTSTTAGGPQLQAAAFTAKTAF